MTDHPQPRGGSAPTRRGWSVAAAGLFLAIFVAGCGGSSASKASATATTGPSPGAGTAVPTAPVPPTLVVTGGQYAAIVNGTSIPMSTYRKLLCLAQRETARQPGVTKQTLAREVLNQLVDDEVVREYAVTHHLQVSTAQINSRIAQDEARLGGKAGLEKQLTQLCVSFAFYQQLTVSDLRRHIVAQRVAPARPVQYARARHILIATTHHKPPRSDAAAHALAVQVLAKVRAGGNFAALAHRYSDDTYSAQKGGDLGVFCPGQMVPPFDHAAFTGPLHTPQLVHSQFGYHILEVLARGRATAQQCAQPLPEQSPAFLSWVNTQVQHARIQRLAKVA
ncbi:MAG TPA: peptidylprolyl isomerase [Chloroflexota bacterium]|nr:peptidylprolyl isomerase [Chloroflexota bacterium]